MSHNKQKLNKEERKEVIKTNNLNQIERLKEDIKDQEHLISNTETYIEVTENQVKLSKELIEIKNKGRTVSEKTGRPAYESNQRYVDIMIEISEKDYIKNKLPSINLNLVRAKADVRGNYLAIEDTKKELAATEKTMEDMKGE